MKYISSILIVLFLINIQKKEKVVFVFNTDAKNMKIKNEYYLIDDFTFKKVNNKSAKLVSFESVKPTTKLLSEFKKMIKNKPRSYPEVFSEFDLFMYLPRSETEGCLVEVEKVWLVEDKIDIAAFPTIIGDIAGNDGVVVCSESTNNHWNFMTLEAPYDSDHPVSGTRQFGYFLDVNGNYVFYTRGVDRFQSNITQNLAGAYSAVNTGSNNPFFGADALWRSFQQGITNFVNNVNNNGSAVINLPQINRPDWQKVKEVLEGTKPISDLGCN